tara:strand:+ start:15655 stop:16971 length:1317 start_codon:yes stop_codon:yes gene_type:complete
MADNPNFKLGDEYTGPARGSRGEVINQKDGTFVEGGVRYVWTGQGNFFKPEGGWSDTDFQIAEDARIQEEMKFDRQNDPNLRGVVRADGSFQPGVYTENEAFYRPQIKPNIETDSKGRLSYLPGPVDEEGNPTWIFNKEFNSTKTPSGTSSGTSYTDYLKELNMTSAKAVIGAFLEKFGLKDLTSWAQEQADLGKSSDAITLELRYGTDPTVRKVYDAAFPAMAKRRAAGKIELTEVESMELQQGYEQIASAAGLVSSFVDTATVTELLINDVSLSEFRERVTTVGEYVRDLSPEAKALIDSSYGFMSDAAMTSYILNPTKAKEVKNMQRDFDVAQLRGTSTQATGKTFGKDLGELLVQNDVQSREIAARLSPLSGLLDSTISSDSVSIDTLTEGTFGLDANSVNKVNRVRGARNVGFSGSSGQLATQEGIVGLGRAT